MIIVLLGYMGSGKTEIGRLLAEMLSYDFTDLDAHIEMEEGQSINAIFQEKGEIYFRKAETKHLKKLLEHANRTVLSLGGGTPCYSNNMELVNGHDGSTSIYLKTSIATLAKRLKIQKADRPLIAHIETEEAMTEFIGKHLFERIPFYNLANTVIETDDKSVQEVVESILLELY